MAGALVEPGQPAVVVRRTQMLMPVPCIEQMDDERCDRDHRENDDDGDQGFHAIPAPFDAQADPSGSPGAVRIQATPPCGARPRGFFPV
ncbi:hypothetical protein, partial [Streptomyces sp. NPDC005989]|uniref:hypothetical protein n=1 Tax=Streptomyces sp. NPDC005989 TaxID=3156727 RepID=UPI0033E1D2FE